jgi:hypothetical protein
VTTKRDLWQYFQEVRGAVEAANRGDASQPYASGRFIVSAVSGEVELTVSDIAEEDAVLIASELSAMGVRAVVRASLVCPACGERVPAQDYCVRCRARLKEG